MLRYCPEWAGFEGEVVGFIVRPLKYPAIDGLRFYAAFVVFLNHFVPPIATISLAVPAASYTGQSHDPIVRVLYFLSDGQHGVDLFFIIGGFLIGRMIMSPERFSYFDFMRRRIARIYPAFLAALIASTIHSCFVHDWAAFDPAKLAKDLFFLTGAEGYNPVNWSLDYEFAFYLTFPVALIAVRAFGAKIATASLFAVALIALPAMYIRGFGLVAGAVIAAWPDDQLKIIAKKMPLLLVLSVYEIPLLLRSSGLALNDFHALYPFFLPGAMLLFVKIAFGENWLSTSLSSAPMRWLGTISYSLYLFHPVMIAIVMNDIVGRAGLQQTELGITLYCSLTVGGTLLVAFASYLAFERSYFSQKRASQLPSSRGCPSRVAGGEVGVAVRVQ
jgi:peptidoglycan/LPS O-acetylase OafA/YrhL